MTIDWTKPLELMDGTPVRIARKGEKGLPESPGEYGEYRLLREDGGKFAISDTETHFLTCASNGSWWFGPGHITLIRNAKLTTDPAKDPAKDPAEIIRALLAYSSPMGGLLGVIAREAAERFLNEEQS